MQWGKVLVAMGTLYYRHPRKEGGLLRGSGCVQQAFDGHDKPVEGGSCGVEEDWVAEEKGEEDCYPGSCDDQIVKVIVSENVFFDIVVELEVMIGMCACEIR